MAVSKWSSTGAPLWAVTAHGRGGSFHIAAGPATDECYISGDFEGGLGFGNHSLYSQKVGAFAAKLGGQPTGVAETINQKLSIYPNPAQNVLFLNMPEASRIVHLQLTDMQGKTVLSQQMPASAEMKLELPELAQGMYILQAQTGKQVFRKKVLIE